MNSNTCQQNKGGEIELSYGKVSNGLIFALLDQTWSGILDSFYVVQAEAELRLTQAEAVRLSFGYSFLNKENT